MNGFTLLAQTTSIFDPASPPAESIRSVSVLVLAITGFIFIVVEGILPTFRTARGQLPRISTERLKAVGKPSSIESAGLPDVAWYRAPRVFFALSYAETMSYPRATRREVGVRLIS
jgi:hypothetical protein